jgi:hypothetical protein
MDAANRHGIFRNSNDEPEETEGAIIEGVLATFSLIVSHFLEIK